MKKKVSPYPPDCAPPLLCPDLKPVLTAHKNPWFKVRSRGSFYTLEYDQPQVAILPVLEGKAVVMLRVKRPLIDDCPLDIPGGGAMPGETPVMAAMREFAEETGIRIKDPARFVPELPISEMPGRMPVLLSVFRIDLSAAEFKARKPHDSEIVSIEAVPFPDLVKKILNGEIYLGPIIAIIARLLLRSLAAGGPKDKC